MKKIRAMVLACLVGLGLMIPATLASPAQAWAPCVGSWSVGIGGLGDNTSSFFDGVVNQRVGYDSANAQAGYWELDRLIWGHRNQCPGDHIEIMAHSQGAGIAHAWVTDHQWFGNANAVLIADPKMWTSWGGPGMSRELFWMGWPMAGYDDWFGNFPTLSVCNWNDHVCRADSGWEGYLFFGAHTNYPRAAWDYDDWSDGVWYR